MWPPLFEAVLIFSKKIKKYLFVLNYFISLPRKTKTNLFIMKPNTLIASSIVAKIIDIANAEKQLSKLNAIIEYRVVITSDRRISLYEIHINRAEESAIFNAEVVTFFDGSASFYFDIRGTENINDFLDIFK